MNSLIDNTGPRDWPEDEKFQDDNAHYQHTCPECKNTFIGHKHRSGGLCKICWNMAETHALERFQAEVDKDLLRPIGPLVMEFKKCPEPPDIPCGPATRTYVPARPGKYKRRTR